MFLDAVSILLAMPLPQRSRPTIHDYLPQILPWMLIAVFAALFIRFLDRPVEVFSSDEELHRFKVEAGIPYERKIILLVTEWCPACKALEHSLNERGTKFSVLDVETSVMGSKLYSVCLSKGAPQSVPKVIYEREMISQSDLFKRLVVGTVVTNSRTKGNFR